MRILLSIGCNIYEHAQTLNGAERDAQRIFDALTKPEVGQFDTEKSALLLSPTIDEVRQALRNTLFGDTPLENFTLFFAGHGGVSSGSFHMWLRDTNPRTQSMSSLALGDLFRFLNETSPKQSNIIIDACQSGGLITDLGVLLKPDLMGDAGTPALTLVATSAQDQTSGETPAGGLGTNAILDCIEGREFVQDHTSVLDLVEIGRHISRNLESYGQNAVVWGLNLYGSPSFCRNPKFKMDPSTPLRNLIHNWPAATDTAIRSNYNEIWSIYGTLEKSLKPDRFISVVTDILSPCRADLNSLVRCAERLAITFSTKAADSNDLYRPLLAIAGVAVCLLPSTGSPVTDHGALYLTTKLTNELIAANETLLKSLQNNKFDLISKNSSGFAEFYQLPIRISRILGWAAYSYLFAKSNSQKEEAKLQFTELLRFTLDNYTGSIIALSDSQAPHWEVTFAAAKQLGLTEESEALIGLLFYSITECKGKLSRCDLSAEHFLTYLMARKNQKLTEVYELIERPIETLSVLLRASKIFEIDNIIDTDLWRIDGLSFSSYHPPSYKHYSSLKMDGGENKFWQIGFDVFRTNDFVQTWNANLEIYSTGDLELATISALLLEDRVPWFCLDPFLANKNHDHPGPNEITDK
ncbi:caspase domain-containing protein [Pseudomonas sp. NPDC096925]|uniref:caspase family protein n=1 Tax=Pseudomonas sp. NPDC096925 TaxID=3364484 RepID=UPI00383A8B0D